MSGEAAFFQIAAGLIPILVFGGVLARRWSFPDHLKDWSWQVIGIFGALGVVAEIFAIKGSVEGHASESERGFITMVILLGMVGLVLASLAEGSERPSAPRLRGGQTRVTIGYAVCAVAIFIALSVATIWISDGIKRGQFPREASQIERSASAAESTLRRIENREERIRKDAIRITRLNYLPSLTAAQRFERRSLKEEESRDRRGLEAEYDLVKLQIHRARGKLDGLQPPPR